MAEGIHAVISADTKDFENALGRSKRSSVELAAALKLAGTQAGSFKPLASKAVTGLQGMKAAADGAKRSFGLAKNSTQQLGYQVQDIAVQLQGGTSAFTVFAQQGSQIAGIFGPGGAVIGAVIAVGAAIGGTLFNSLVGAKEETKDWREEIDALVNSLRNLSLMELNDAAQQTQDIIESLTDRMARLRAQIDEEAEDGNWVAADKLEKKYGELNQQLQRYGLTLKDIGLQQGKLFAMGDLAADKKGASGASDPIMTLQQQLQQRIALIRQFDSLEVETLAAKLLLQKEQIAIALENEAITKQEARDYQLAAEDQYQQSLTAITAREAQNRASIEQQVQNQILAMKRGALGNAVGLLQVLGAKSKAAAIAAIALSKGQMIAQTIASTAAAELHALAVLGPIAGPPAAASIKAWGMANVGLIAATGLAQAASLGSSGGGSSTAAGVTNGASGSAGGGQSSQPQNRVVTLNFEGNEMLQSLARQLVGPLNDAFDDGYTINIG